jgi:DNA-binding CsgD family transcriptional regulator
MMPVTMVGRADELGELTSAWARLAAPRPGSRRGAARPVAPPPRTAVVTGAGGSGKSLLASAALTAFDPPPSIVLSGQARVHTPAPYDWLAAVLTDRDTDDLQVPADALAWLAQHPYVPGNRYAPAALLRLAVRTVRALVGTGPALLVVEDLHALDPASLNLVAELAAAPGLPAMLLVTSRTPDAAVSPELTARALARLAGTPGAIRQHLAPLRPVDVADLLRPVHSAPVPARVAHAIWARTGGNPYWLTELLAARRGAPPEVLAYGPLPEHLRFMTGTEIAGTESGEAAGAEAALPVAEDLTAREREVLSCLAAGMSNKEVARSLGISIRTVTVHVSRLLRKTRSTSRTEAALWAVRHQLTG